MAFRPGFDDRWESETDFILGITKDIWEDRRIDTLSRYYAPDLVVRSPASIVRGNGGIIAATQSTLAEFPDRQLPGEDVIWTEVSATAFLSSHRLICQATHAGHGVYGAPTGRRLEYRIIADCYCEGNAVTDEWLVRDQGAILRQMGEDPHEWTCRLIENEGGPGSCVQPFTPASDVDGPYPGETTWSSLAAEVAQKLEGFVAGEFDRAGTFYDRSVEGNFWNHETVHGCDAVRDQWVSLRAAFPSSSFRIDHAMCRQVDPNMPPRAAFRWTLDGHHDGPGLFGTPTGAHVHVMGMTHQEIGPRGIRREWTLIDETAIWKQILLANTKPASRTC
jgi:predicted ester cyclase